MRTLTALVLVVLMTGCAAQNLKPAMEAPDAARDHCTEYASTTDFSTGEKALIYASNVIVFPVTTALTLGFGGVFVYPKSTTEAWGWRYESCMAKAGYK